MNWSAGLRYAHLDQQLVAQQSIGVATGLTTVSSKINFDGFGIGFGLDGDTAEAHAAGCSFTPRGWGELRRRLVQGEYQQVNQLGSTAVIANDWEDFRLASILESEIGLGWQNDCG